MSDGTDFEPSVASALLDDYYREHPDPDGECSGECSHDLAEHLRAALDEIDRLNKQASRDEYTLGRTIDERERFHEIADQLASVIAPPEVLGEHSSGNSPWHNALEYVHPITEEMVDEAIRALWTGGFEFQISRGAMRAALEAAEAKR